MTTISPAQLRAWRKHLRETLIGQRMALSATELLAKRLAIDQHLESGFPDLARGVVAFCWPYQNEYDSRYLVRRLRGRGAVTALPVVVAAREPLIFREWHPGVRLVAGVYGIPYPESGPALTPNTALVPMTGFDGAGYRLGYGGGYFDRTLAVLAPRPLAIGIAFEIARIATIRPQPYDQPMDFVVTERGIYRRHHFTLSFVGAPSRAAKPNEGKS